MGGLLAWLLPMIIQFAVKFGIAAVVAWLKKHWNLSVTPEWVESILIQHDQKQKALHAETTTALKVGCGVGPDANCSEDSK